tara:strand:- start:725 stop:937 length:213 start_codon:yes stop_codon:yes gene_type:complete
MKIAWTILIILGCISFLISIYYFILTYIRDRKKIRDLTSQENNQAYIVPITRGIPVNSVMEGIIIIEPIE